MYCLLWVLVGAAIVLSVALIAIFLLAWLDSRKPVLPVWEEDEDVMRARVRARIQHWQRTGRFEG
jgi:hypothetical protein